MFNKWQFPLSPSVLHFIFINNNLSNDTKVQFSSVQSLSHVWLFATPWTAACQASWSITNSWSPPKPISIKSMMPPNHLILCRPLLLLSSIFPSIRVFSNDIVLKWKSQNPNHSQNPSAVNVLQNTKTKSPFLGERHYLFLWRRKGFSFCPSYTPFISTMNM